MDRLRARDATIEGSGVSPISDKPLFETLDRFLLSSLGMSPDGVSMAEIVIRMSVDPGAVNAGARRIVRSLEEIERAADGAMRGIEQFGRSLHRLEAAARTNSGTLRQVASSIDQFRGSIAAANSLTSDTQGLLTSQIPGPLQVSQGTLSGLISTFDDVNDALTRVTRLKSNVEALGGALIVLGQMSNPLGRLRTALAGVATGLLAIGRLLLTTPIGLAITGTTLFSAVLATLIKRHREVSKATNEQADAVSGLSELLAGAAVVSDETAAAKLKEAQARRSALLAEQQELQLSIEQRQRKLEKGMTKASPSIGGGIVRDKEKLADLNAILAANAINVDALNDQLLARTERIRDSFVALRSELDPTTASFEQYRQNLDLLNDAFDEGIIGGPEFQKRVAELNKRFVESGENADALAQHQLELNRAEAEAVRVFSDLQKPLQSYNEDLTTLNELLIAGVINQDQFDRASALATQRLNEVQDDSRQESPGTINDTLCPTEALERQRDCLLLESGEAADGLQAGLLAYAESALDVNEQVKAATMSAFQGMEDALVSFVQTGKLDFKSLADSIIADLIRISIKAAILGSFAKFLGGLGDSAPVDSTGGTGIGSPGGPINDAATPKTSIANIANGARGPAARSRPDRMAQGGPVNLTVNVNNEVPEARVEARRVTDDQGGIGLEIQVARIIAKDVRQGGEVFRSFRDTFGVNQQRREIS